MPGAHVGPPQALLSSSQPDEIVQVLRRLITCGIDFIDREEIWPPLRNVHLQKDTSLSVKPENLRNLREDPLYHAIDLPQEHKLLMTSKMWRQYLNIRLKQYGIIQSMTRSGVIIHKHTNHNELVW